MAIATGMPFTPQHYSFTPAFMLSLFYHASCKTSAHTYIIGFGISRWCIIHYYLLVTQNAFGLLSRTNMINLWVLIQYSWRKQITLKDHCCFIGNLIKIGQELCVMSSYMCWCCSTYKITSRFRFPGTTVQLGGILDCLCGRIRIQAVCSAGCVAFPVKKFPQRGLAPVPERIHSILHPGCLLLLNLIHGDTYMGLNNVIHTVSLSLSQAFMWQNQD